MSKVAIKANDVFKTYTLGEITINALQGVSFEIEKGEMLAIMGPSGSGKSTLMNLIGCLDVPTKGEIYIDGESVNKKNDNALSDLRLRKVGFVFQQFNLISNYTAIENVELPLLYAGVTRKERRKRAEEALIAVGLKERMKHLPSKLSGGQKQRVALARAIINNPSIILADEPTGALDTATGKDVMDLFSSLNSDGRTIVIVTHDPKVGAQCKRIINILDGRVRE